MKILEYFGLGNSSFEISINDTSKDAEFTTFTHPLVSGIYLKKLKIFVLYYSRASTLKSTAAVSFKAVITTPNQSFKLILQFSIDQEFVAIPNIDLPVKLHISTSRKIFSKKTVPYPGIYNLGLTCYINSSIQFLNSASPIRQLMFEQNPNTGSLSDELQKIFLEMNSQSDPISLRSFVKALGGNIFSVIAMEQDAHEFITSLFDKLDTELGKEFVKSREEACGIVESRVLECPAAKIKNEVTETSNEIQVTVQGFSSLEESLRYATATEMLVGANKWDAGEGFGKQDAKRYTRFKKLPKFLIFHLVRFAYNRNTQRVEEVRSQFDCPDKIDMKEFCLPEVELTNYTLVSIVAHRGNLMSGHYVAYTQPNCDGNWFLFNDSAVSAVSQAEVKATFSEQSSIYSSMLSYIGRKDFLAYIVGYIRDDQLKRRIRAPSRICHLVSNSLSARLVTEKDLTVDVYNSGELETVSKNETIKDIFSKEENVFYFMNLPGMNNLIGPIEENTKAGAFLIPKSPCSLFALPKKYGKKPVFILDGENVKIISSEDLFSEYKDSNIFCKHIQVFKPDDLEAGSIISLLPNIVKLTIDEKQFEVERNATYSDIQKLINSESPERVVFTTRTKILLPMYYKQAEDFRNEVDITSSLLQQGSTLSQIEFFQRIKLYYFDTKKNEQQLTIWPLKGCTVDDVTKYIKEIMQIKSGELVLSPFSNVEISKILAPFSILRDFTLRADLVEMMPSLSISSCYQQMNDKRAIIEVRHANGVGAFRNYTTLGFRRITSKMSAQQLADELGIKNPTEFIVRSARDFRIRKEFASTMKFGKLFGDVISGMFEDRPVIIICTEAEKE